MANRIRKLPVLERIFHYWDIFYGYAGPRIWLYIFLSLLATLTESLGIGLFFPLFNGLSGNSNSPPTVMEVKFASALRFFGLNYNLKAVLAGIVVVFFCKAILQLLASMYQAKIITQFMNTIMKRVFAAVTGQDYGHFLSRNIGVLANATVNESNRAMIAFMKYASLFPPMIAIGVFSLLAFRLDWRATVSALAFGLAALLCLRYVARMARQYSYQNTEAAGTLNGLVLQAYGSFKYLSATFGFSPLRQQVERTIDRLSGTQFFLSSTACFSQSFNEPLVVLFLVGLIWQQVFIAGNPLSGVVVLALFFFRLMNEVMNLQSGWHGFSSTMGSIDLVSSVVVEGERAKENFHGQAYKGIQQAIVFENTSFSYGAKQVLRNLNLTILRNSMVAVVGESGAGKSTFVDLLTGLLKPSVGRILIDGLPYNEINLASFRARIGYVTQEPALFNDTVANNISFWDANDSIVVRKKILAAAEAANCTSFLDGLAGGIDTILGDRGVNLSGGQKQRVAIARELYKQPDLLIFDEATSSLDSEAEGEIQRSIEAFRGKLTTVVIAHRLSTIRNADVIFVFSGGALVEQGNFSALFAQTGSHFRKFCGLQGLS